MNYFVYYINGLLKHTIIVLFSAGNKKKDNALPWPLLIVWILACSVLSVSGDNRGERKRGAGYRPPAFRSCPPPDQKPGTGYLNTGFNLTRNKRFCSSQHNYYHSRQHESSTSDVRVAGCWQSSLDTNLKTWRRELFHFFSLLQSDMAFGIQIRPFFADIRFRLLEWEKVARVESLPLTYIDVTTVEYFPPVKSWLVNSDVIFV